MDDGKWGMQPREGSPEGSVSIRVVDSNSDLQRMTAADLMPADENEAGILATARNSAGGPAGRLTDDSVVKYQGMELTLKTAASMGLIARNADGSYSERGAALAPQQKPTPTQPPVEDTSTEQEQQGEEPAA